MIMSFYELLIILFVTLIVASVAYNLFAFHCVAAFFTEKNHQIPAQAVPMPVSIIKPLKGFDENFRSNLETFCTQDYPCYEVLLGFSDPADPAVPVANDLAASHKACCVSTIINAKKLGTNKKVSNLKGLVESATYDLLVISDSDMSVERSYLRNILSEYSDNKNIGLVTCLYKISHPRTPGAALESLTIALDFIPSVLVAQRLEGITFGLGATLVISKKALDDIGGLATIADYLADDYQIGNRLWKKGYHIVLSDVVLENDAGPMSISDFFAHQLRWARTYRASRPKGYVGYGISHLFPLSLFFFFMQGPTIFALLLLASALTIRLGLASLVSARVIRKKHWIRWIPLLPLKDLFSFGIWAWSFLTNKVTWRGISFRITKGGFIKEEV